MFEAPDHPYRIPEDGSFRIADSATAPPADAPDKDQCKKRLKKLRKRLRRRQRVLHADGCRGVLLVLQGMDASGKDSTVRTVMRGVNPAGCDVWSFGRPTEQALRHDFLWRAVCRLPERGRIGIFNRSHYEDVLITRVHPQLLASQCVTEDQATEQFWAQRYAAIREHEAHWARNGLLVLKCFLNISREVQRQRFLSRIDKPHKHWKFAAADVEERQHWDRYMAAYEQALNATARPEAPWYAIPADHKPYLRLCVAEILVEALENMELGYPQPSEQGVAELKRVGELLRRGEL